MKSNELRIGNLLYDNKDRLCKVEEIRIDEFKAPAIKGPITSLPNKPIPLDEEWLKSFGFDYDFSEKDHNAMKKDEFVIHNYWHSGKWNNFYLDREMKWKVNCVHELQNIHFMLTGEELKIKEGI